MRKRYAYVLMSIAVCQMEGERGKGAGMGGWVGSRGR